MRATSITLLFVLILFSCGQVKKAVAIEDLLGKYSGTVTYVVKHSLQNVGLEDDTQEQKVTISIFRNNSDQVFARTGDGSIKLSGITLAFNGTAFNISNQNTVNNKKETLNLQGFQTAELDGVKFDGIYNSDINSLTFGYETSINYDYWGTMAPVSVMAVYEFSKIN